MQEGQEIAALDGTALQIKRDTVASQLAAAQAQLQALIDGPTPADLAAQPQAVATAQTSLVRTQYDLNNLLTGATPEDLATARANLDRATAALAVAHQLGQAGERRRPGAAAGVQRASGGGG